MWSLVKSVQWLNIDVSGRRHDQPLPISQPPPNKCVLLPVETRWGGQYQVTAQVWLCTQYVLSRLLFMNAAQCGMQCWVSPGFSTLYVVQILLASYFRCKVGSFSTKLSVTIGGSLNQFTRFLITYWINMTQNQKNVGHCTVTLEACFQHCLAVMAEVGSLVPSVSKWT